MERLTFEGNFCDIAMCMVECGGEFCKERTCSQKKTWERLKWYEDLADQGRLAILPPCKVGDAIYINCYGKLAETTIKGIGVGLRDRLYLSTGCCAPWADELGKTWFLTREEAEAALKEAKDDG